MPSYCNVVVDRPILSNYHSARVEHEYPLGGADNDPRANVFTYSVPAHLEALVQAGQIVEVPFRGRPIQGIVVSLPPDAPAGIDPRPVSAILDPQPVLNSAQLAVTHWMSRHYVAPLSECVWLFVPSEMRRNPVTVAEATRKSPAREVRDAAAANLLAFLQQRGATDVSRLDADALSTLQKAGLARTGRRLAPPRVGPLIDRTVEILVTPDDVDVVLPTLGRPSKQADVLLHLACLENPKPLVADVKRAVGCATAHVQRLSEAGLVIIETGPEPTIRLNVQPEEVVPIVLEMRGTTVEADVLDMLANEEGPVWVGWVYAQTDATLKNLRRLADAGLVALDDARRWRDPLSDLVFVPDAPPQLTDDQKEVCRRVSENAAEGTGNERPFLLHGVTGSGKTEIYLQAAAQTLARGKGVVFLVPEIALATQTIQRVARRFPDRVAVWHSRLSPGERFDTWQRIRQGRLPVVVGARSALFCPVPRLGLIVVDEEHEPAFKHGRSPRIHAREVAVALAKECGATIILGSATPDVVTMRRAERGEYTLLTLPRRVLAHKQDVSHMVSDIKRVGAVPPGRMASAVQDESDMCSLPLPPVEIVSLPSELRAGNTSIFSRALQDALEETLARRQQAILFLNRRGSSTFVVCRDCGYVAKCPRCQMPLTYHSEHEALLCHHCSHRNPHLDRCPACGSGRIRYFGLGTERVEETVRDLFPRARTLRWDKDTAHIKGGHESILHRFAERQADVLVGTQMIAKGLDLPFVTLVGVVSADTGLFMPDFRAAERTFQLLTQVAGRAGRSPLGGRVIFQTYSPDLPAIRAAAEHDYHTFYRHELEHRRSGPYPPFKQMARLVVGSSRSGQARQNAQAMADALRSHMARRGVPATDIIGPAPCFFSRLRGTYRWQILVRADKPEELFRSFPLPAGWQIDVDPTDFL